MKIRVACAFAVSVMALCWAENCLAYKIISKDEGCWVFKSGKIEKDPNRYQVVYEVDEANRTLSVIQETDLRTGEQYSVPSVFQILEQPTLEFFKQGNALKAVRFNPVTANLESISFSGGEYHYSKMTEKYANLFYGTYTIDF